MAGLYLGSDELFKAALGSDDGIQVYLGDELLWPQVREYKAALTLSGGTVVYVPVDGSSTLTSGEVNTAVSEISAITDVEITSAVTVIGSYAFNYCTKASAITIPTSVTTINERSFANCKSLSDITFPSGVTSIGKNAFYGSGHFSGLTVEATTPPTLGSGAFSFTQISQILVPCDSVDAYKAAANWSSQASRIHGYGCPPKVILTLTGGTTVEIPDDGSGKLTSGEVVSNVSSMADIASADISSAVTEIGGFAFSGASAMTSVSVQNGLTTIGSYAFLRCFSFTGLAIPNSVTSIGKGAFSSCSGMTSADIPSGVTTVGEFLFSDCYSLSSVTIPSGVTSVGRYAFENCSGMTSISLPSGVTSIGTNAFSGCRAMTSFTIPSGITTIADNAFKNCVSLTGITIPSGITSIGLGAFSGCSSISSVTIPSGVTSIGINAFASCASLVSTTVEATTPPTSGQYVFNNNNQNLVIYVPCGSLSAYQSASNWNYYSQRMQEYGCSDGPSATIHLKYYSDDGCEGEGCDIEEDRYIYGDITRAAVESAITDHDDVEDMDVVRWGDVVYIEVASGVTSIGSGAFDFHDDPMDNWKILYVKFLGTTPPTIGSHAFGGGDEYIDSMRYYILVPSAATTAYTSAFSAQSADFDGIYPSDVPCMAAVTSTREGDPPTTSTTYVYGPATLINLAKNLGVWNDELGVVSWGDFNGQIEEVRIGSAATSIAADAFNNTADHVNCEEGVFKWIIDTDTVTSIGVDAFGWLNMKEVWLSGSTNVLHLDPMDHASFKVACPCPQYDEELDEDVDVDTWFNYKIYVDDTLLSAYQADSKWSGYGNRIKGESDWEEPEIDWCNHIDEEEPQI